MIRGGEWILANNAQTVPTPVTDSASSLPEPSRVRFRVAVAKARAQDNAWVTAFPNLGRLQSASYLLQDMLNINPILCPPEPANGSHSPP